MHVLFYQSVIAMQECNKKPFQQYFQQFAQLVVSNGYEYFLQRPTILGPSNRMIFYELLQFSQKCQMEHPSIIALQSYFQVEDGISYPHDEVQMNLFGSLNLIRTQRKLEDKEWQRDKSKELLCTSTVIAIALLQRKKLHRHYGPIAVSSP